MAKGRKKVTDSERITVSCSEDGKGWFVYHKGLGTQPRPCRYEQLAETIRDIAIQVGKIRQNP